jgi:hypothetical protein
MCLFFDPYTLFTLLTFLFRNTSGHTSPGRKSFSFFSQEHHTFFGQPTFSDNNGGLAVLYAGRTPATAAWLVF